MSQNKPARRIVLTLLACGLVSSLGAATASAQSPARDGYDGTNVISNLPKFGERAADVLPPQFGVAGDFGAGGAGGADDPYGPNGGSNGAVGGTLGASAAGDPPTATSRSNGAGSLPFTGFEGGLIAIMGLALIATGFALRRAGSARRS